MTATAINQHRLRIAQRAAQCGFPRRHCDELGYERAAITREQEAGWKRLWHAIRSGGTVYFYGGFGVGKTILAAAVAFHWIDKRDRNQLPANVKGLPRYWTARQLFDEQLAWQKANTDRESPVKLAERVGFLVIDELGQSRFTDFQSTEISGIVDTRYTNRRPTLLIANESPQAIAKLGLSPLVLDRTREGGAVIDASGWPNMRRQE
jgi:DNA replication protein DnaC/putative replication protein